MLNTGNADAEQQQATDSILPDAEGDAMSTMGAHDSPSGRAEQNMHTSRTL